MLIVGLSSSSTIALYTEIDKQIASAIQKVGCPFCNDGSLHASHYQRKLHGVVGELSPEDTLRLSFCCSKDGCRHRVTPPSIRFWGRLRYAASAMLALLYSLPNSPQEKQLRHDAECSRSSIYRWRARFRDLWETTAGRTLAGRISLDAQQRQEPRRMLAQWRNPWPAVVAMWQLFIHPLTGGTNWETQGLRIGALDPQRMGFESQLSGLQHGVNSP